jgi:hypothetical protein
VDLFCYGLCYLQCICSFIPNCIAIDEWRGRVDASHVMSWREARVQWVKCFTWIVVTRTRDIVSDAGQRIVFLGVAWPASVGGGNRPS